jgi:D-lactate dehydrogenase
VDQNSGGLANPFVVDHDALSDRERRDRLIERLQQREGISSQEYQSAIEALAAAPQRFGFDVQGRMRVAVFDARSYDIDYLSRANAGRLAFTFLPSALSLDTASSAAGFLAVCLFVNDQADAPVIRRLASLGVRMIALRCAGYNNVDLEECAACGISVARVPAYSPHAVAEHTVALMLMLNRKLHQAYLRNRAGAFVLDGLTGFDMHGKTAGVIGAGKIGQCVVDILLGFGCRVLVHEKAPSEALRASKAELVDRQTLFQQSDIVTLHVPLFPETYHLINQDAIQAMKRGVMIINTSRGGLIDTRALIAGLKSGQVGSAGLDVYEEEAGIFFQDLSGKVLTDDVLARLMTFNNVVVTSHQGFLTHEALTNIADTTIANILEFQAGKRGETLTNAVLARAGR